MNRDVLKDFESGYRKIDTSMESFTRTPLEPNLLAVLLGRIFRQKKLTPPKALTIDIDGVMCITINSGQQYGLFNVAGITYFIDKNGRTLSIGMFKKLTTQTDENLDLILT